MNIPLPGGDVLIPDADFAAKIGATRRTLGNLDHEGCPFILLGGKKYRPEKEALSWVASRIQRKTSAAEK